MPGLFLEAAQDVIVLGVQLDLVLIKVVKQIISAEDLCDLDQLIRVAVAVEEGLLAEDHGGEHGAQAPHVEAVVVLLEVDQKLRTLEIARRDTDIVFRAGVVKFSQAPVDEAQLRMSATRDITRRDGKQAYLSVLVVDHDVVRLHISVHDALAVAEVESLEQLEDVEADVEVGELGVEAPEVGVVDVFEDERRGLTLGQEAWSVYEARLQKGGGVCQPANPGRRRGGR